MQIHQNSSIRQDILKQHAGSDFAFQAQKKLTILYIAWGKKPQAEAAFQELANLSVSADITAAIKDMASYYRRLQKHEEPDKHFQYYQALSICRRQLDVVDQPGNEYAMWSQVRLAMSNIELGDAAAQAAIDKLLTEFSDNTQIARGVHEVALKYRVLKKYEKAVELYQYVVDYWPNAEYTVWSQMDLVKSYVALGDDPNAEAAVDKLLANFSNNPNIAQTVYDMASCYRGVKKHSKAINLYQHIIDNWPQQKYAMWSLRDLAMSNVDRGDDPNAQAAVDKLIANYSDHVHVPWNLYEIAKYYRKYAKYKKAINLYQRIVDNWPDAEHAMLAQADLIKSYLALGDEIAARAAVDKLLANFTDNPLIVRAIHDTAYEYRKLQRYEKADELDQYVIDNWPEDEQTMWAKMDMAKSNIVLGNNAAAEATINNLIADFNNHPDLAQAIFRIGESYYNKAFRHENQGLDAEAKDYFRKTIAVWERIITDLSSSPITPQAYYMSARCYERNGQYENAMEYYNIVVDNWPDYERAWNAQFLIARCFDKLARSGSIPRVDAAPLIRHACEKLITNYPDSKAVKAAINLLKRWESVNSPCVLT